MIRYLESTVGIDPEQLVGFFRGWPSHPDPAAHLELLRGSDAIALALDSETDTVIGFVTAITDGVLSAYLPLLEVLPSHQRRGIGSELVRRVLEQLRDLYMVDVVCDPDVLPFYERLGFAPGTAAMRRRYDRQSGAPEGNSTR